MYLAFGWHLGVPAPPSWGPLIFQVQFVYGPFHTKESCLCQRPRPFISGSLPPSCPVPKDQELGDGERGMLSSEPRPPFPMTDLMECLYLSLT